MAGTFVGGYRCAMSWRDLDMTFDLAKVALTIKFCPSNISETVNCSKLIVERDIAQGL